MGSEDLGGRLPLLPPASLRPEARQLYDRLMGGRLSSTSPFTSRIDTGELIGPFNAFLHAPAIGGGFVDFHEAEEHSTPLSPRVREIVILSVGAVWGSAYETYAHRAIAAQVGFAPDVAAALAAGVICEGISAEERLAQRFALDLVRDRIVDDATYLEAERVFGREGLVALVFVAAAYDATCVILNAFAVPAPSPD
ncbi:carboxymuconolactone decarboxylase family protein [Lichenihabitans sp. PAMC28606]|uniref:carboxymuconolactone decarboxylase family protein n=1 Tax=Lichenihabitans sp. PAMC28606 TaxID=2880932 RepID=UPI001D0AB6D9|nr:carboxymuconolactone decarboxylase family protein [Lichenihabitans sp. PAMC28606]UDL94068.1 carboxymuconolactone decarboxylase family protein [Lichenihabitans sp. PAMC28606]